jgi:hypothetical protein
MDLKSGRNTILGIDIGSVALSLVQTDLEKFLSSSYSFHHGRVGNFAESSKDIDTSIVRNRIIKTGLPDSAGTMIIRQR